MSLSLSSAQVARKDQLHTEAQLAADAGADYAIEKFSQDNTWTGQAETVLRNDGKIKTTYTASISGDDKTKTIAVTGKTYWPAAKSTPSRSVRINVDLRPVTQGNYSIVAGTGGLYMQNSSKVVGGSVFINGELNMSNSSQIGLTTSPVNVQVANLRCPNPPDSTYPRQCANGENGQPITISNPAMIYGSVTANGQTNGSRMTNPGLVGGTVTPQTLPTYNRASQKAAVANTLTGAAASCSGKQSVTWPANVKITGNVTLGNQCQIIVSGDAWITGNLTAANSSQIVIANTVGTNRPDIMIDGSAGLSLGTSSSVVPNSSGTGAEFYTFYSTAGCSPDCSTVTGTALASSRSISTINLNQSASAASSILYAYWTQVQLGNSGQVGAVVGQTIQMSNSATITFGTSAAVGTTVWVAKGYRQQ